MEGTVELRGRYIDGDDEGVESILDVDRMILLKKKPMLIRLINTVSNSKLNLKVVSEI